MSEHATQERIAQLQARAHAQRLAAQLALLEVREQLAPLRSAVGMLGTAARIFSPGRSAGALIRRVTRVGISHPWLGSALGAAALSLLRRRPLAVLLATATGVAAWWLFRPSPKADSPSEPPG